MTNSELKVIQSEEFWTKDNEKDLYSKVEAYDFKELNKFMGQIDEKIKTYYNTGNGYTYSELIALRDELSSLLWFMADLLKKIKTKYNLARFTRKIRFSRIKQELIELKNTVSSSDNDAGIQTEDELRREMSLESEAYGLELKLDALNQIINSISSRIRFEEIENRQTKNLI